MIYGVRCAFGELCVAVVNVHKSESEIGKVFGGIMLLRKELEAMALPFRSVTPPNATDEAKQDGVGAFVDNEKAKKKLTKSKSAPKFEDVVLRRDENREKLFMRPGVIDEEPDSMDSIISDPSSFPITIVPSSTSGGGGGGASSGLLIRNSTAQSLSRISTSSK